MTTHASMNLEITDGIAEVTLTGPGKGNAMGPDFWRDLPMVFDILDSDDAVRAVILRGDGPNFSYGLDLPAMAPALASGDTAVDRAKLLDTIQTMQAAVTRVQTCRKPVIAAVRGWCIGGGLDLIAACDIRLCSTDARFSLREARIAIVADIGSLQRLPPIIGEGNTRELAFTARDIDAQRALRIGLVNEVYDGPQALEDAARAMAREIAANAPLAVQGAKRVLNESQGKPVEEGLRYVALWNAAYVHTQDLTEAISAFIEKRPPRYEGR
ncbi:MAG TPA: crotonase/enoyl-CoA hydratase family protein [Ktedonobacterales bacterium]